NNSETEEEQKIARILDSISATTSGLTRLEIMAKSYLSFKVVTHLLQFLLKEGFIKFASENSRYHITEQGRIWLKYHGRKASDALLILSAYWMSYFFNENSTSAVAILAAI